MNNVAILNLDALTTTVVACDHLGIFINLEAKCCATPCMFDFLPSVCLCDVAGKVARRFARRLALFVSFVRQKRPHSFGAAREVAVLQR